MRKIIHALMWLKRGLLKDYSQNIKIFNLLEKKIGINKNQNIKMLDIGSHSGSWTMPFCKYYKKSESICFEAYEYYYDVFRILIKFFPFYKISCHNYAVLDQETIVNINYKDKISNKLLTGMNFVSKKHNNSYFSKKIHSISIDNFKDLNLDNLKYIKIDIEGGELLALNGSINIIKKYRPIIIFEFYGKFAKRFNYSFNDIRVFFDSINFQIYSIIDLKLLKFEKNHLLNERNFYAISK